MPHVHSFARRRERYLRAVNRGYIASAQAVGSSPVKSASDAIPGPWRLHYYQQVRVAQFAIAAQLLIAIRGYRAPHLGGAYQLLRKVVPDFVSSGLRKLNRCYKAVRHIPMGRVSSPVGFGLLRLLRNIPHANECKALVGTCATSTRDFAGRDAAMVLIIQRWVRNVPPRLVVTRRIDNVLEQARQRLGPILTTPTSPEVTSPGLQLSAVPDVGHSSELPHETCDQFLDRKEKEYKALEAQAIRDQPADEHAGKFI